MKIRTILFFLFISVTTYAQCNYKKTIVEGKTMIQFPPRPVSADLNRQYALSINQYAESTSLVLTIRFKGKHQISNSNLILDLSNGETLNLKSIQSDNDFIGGSELTYNQYLLKISDIQLLKNTQINAIKLNFDSGDKIYLTTSNFKDYIKQNLNCLE